MRFELHWHYTDPETSRHDLGQQGRRDDREKNKKRKFLGSFQLARKYAAAFHSCIDEHPYSDVDAHF